MRAGTPSRMTNNEVRGGNPYAPSVPPLEPLVVSDRPGARVTLVPEVAGAERYAVALDLNGHPTSVLPWQDALLLGRALVAACDIAVPVNAEILTATHVESMVGWLAGELNVDPSAPMGTSARVRVDGPTA